MGNINLPKWAEVEGGGEPTWGVLQRGHGDKGSQPHKAEAALAETQPEDDSVGGGRPCGLRVSCG